MATQNADLFDAYFRRADLDQDGRITGAEAVAFFQNSNLPKQVLAQIWTYADQHKTGFLGRNEFYNFLKLVTVAQSKRELTPDIVKAALYGPASAKIPPPQINLAVTSAPPPNPTTVPAPSRLSAAASTPSQSMGVSVPQVSANVNVSQQFFPSQANQMGKPPRPAPATASLHPQQGVAASNPPSTKIAPNWHGGTPNTLAGQATPLSARGITSSASEGVHGMTTLDITSAPPRPQASAGMMPLATSKSYDATMPSSQVGAEVSKYVAVSGNGPAPNSFSGDAFSVTSPLPSQDTSASAFPVDGSSVLQGTVPASTGSQTTVRPSSFGSSPVPLTQQLTGNQHQQVMMKVNQQAPEQNSTIYGASTAGIAGAPHSASGQFQISWPRMTPIDVQKYNKVFIEVDSDRDGKITGEQARNLFLSWRLPREILKQVWDLSDQDNDSMLSLREFCIALYLMERYREGRPLPKTLPNSIMIDEALLPASGRHAAVHGHTAWRPAPGLQQPQVTPAARPPIPPRPKPPNQIPVPLPDGHIQPPAQKSKVPILEKHLVNQLSEGEQNLLNAKFNEASEANKKVEELEKEIVDSRKKIEFFRSKMQELVLYKSRCDNRLNEITERTTMDKREVESLAKKYEEKYQQSGDVASKLSIEEATFRDIQEKKMELYRSIVKLEDGKADSIQINADKIQFELEELMKSVNERCKSYGLRAKPTTLVELPFGWQPGIQEGTADWDENWDKFEDEGFTFIKDLTLDVQNVVAPPKPKTSSLQSEGSSTEDGMQDALANGDQKLDKIPIGEDQVNDEASSEEGKPKSLPESPAHAASNPSQKFPSDPSRKEFIADGSPHAVETQSELGGSEFLFSGDKSSDKPGAFDMHFDTESAWDFDPGSSKGLDFDKRMGYSFFDSGDLGLPPIRTDASQQKKTFVFDSVPSTPQTENLFQKKSTFSFDSVPSTPQADSLFPTRSKIAFDSVPSTPLADNSFPTKSAFAFDSVPSTPQADNMFQKKTTFAFDSIPNTPQADNLFQQKSAFAFDSVPSTPMYNYNSNSPRRLSEGSELSKLDSFSRFDSFNTHDGGLFPAREPLSRFDSFSSTRESDYGQGFSSQDAFPRFDSFRSTTKDSDSGFFAPRDYARFDSFQSTKDSDDSRGFNTFDEPDPFGSSGPFKTSFYSQTPRRDSDDWKAF